MKEKLLLIIWGVTLVKQGVYPGYEGDLDVEGSVTLNFLEGLVMIQYDLTDVDPLCTTPTDGKFLW